MDRLKIISAGIKRLRPQVGELSNIVDDSLDFVKANFLSSLRPKIALSVYELDAWADYIRYLSKVKLISKPQEINAIKNIQIARDEIVQNQRLGLRQITTQKTTTAQTNISPRIEFGKIKINIPPIEIIPTEEFKKIPHISFPKAIEVQNISSYMDESKGYQVLIKSFGGVKRVGGIYSARDARNLMAAYLDYNPSRTGRIVRSARNINASFNNGYYDRFKYKFRTYRIIDQQRVRPDEFRLIEKRKYFNDLERMGKR
jgi:hypothetical protein